MLSRVVAMVVYVKQIKSSVVIYHRLSTASAKTSQPVLALQESEHLEFNASAREHLEFNAVTRYSIRVGGRGHHGGVHPANA
jgi:hypothetical protein